MKVMKLMNDDELNEISDLWGRSVLIPIFFQFISYSRNDLNTSVQLNLHGAKISFV